MSGDIGSYMMNLRLAFRNVTVIGWVFTESLMSDVSCALWFASTAEHVIRQSVTAVFGQCVLSYVQHFSAWLMSRHRARIKFVWPEHLSVTLPRHWYNTWNIPLLTVPGYSLAFVGIHADCLVFDKAVLWTCMFCNRDSVRDIMWHYATVAFVCCCSYLLEPGLNTFTLKIFCSNYQSLKNERPFYIQLSNF